jgi:ribosomal protein L11 methylase PrmA
MSDLIVEVDVIQRMRVDLGYMLTEFEDASANSDSVAESAGHPDLADKVLNIAHNWEQCRNDRIEQMRTTERNLAEIHKQFDTIGETLNWPGASLMAQRSRI